MEKKPLNDASYEQYLNERRIMGSHCTKCGALALPPRPICISWHGFDLEWVEFKGRGKLAALTSIVVVPPAMAREGFGRNNPYIVGVVELDEGVKAVARIMGVDAKNPDQIRVGTPLQADFLSKGDGPERQISLVFKP
jgi:uncharacterized OB-fold protein